MQVQSLDREDPLEEEVATHSGILAWEIPWTQEPGGLQSMGLHDLVTEHNNTDCSPPGSSVHGISQARIPEWVAISFSRGSFRPRDPTPVFCIGRRILYH